MSDDDDFMLEDEEEVSMPACFTRESGWRWLQDYDFDYEDDEEEEPDVDLENKYYNAKGSAMLFWKKQGSTANVLL